MQNRQSMYPNYKNQQNLRNDQQNYSRRTQKHKEKKWTHELLLDACKHTTCGKILHTQNGAPQGQRIQLQLGGR